MGQTLCGFASACESEMPVVSYIGEFSHNDVVKLARRARGNDQSDYQTEFILLLELARSVGR